VCDTNCAGGCFTKGAGKCDTKCKANWRLSTSSYTCERKNDSLYCHVVVNMVDGS